MELGLKSEDEPTEEEKKHKQLGAVPKKNGGGGGNSPPLTVGRLGRSSKNGQWQDFIDREQSSVGQLIREGFAEYRKDGSVGNGGRMRSGSADGTADVLADLDRLKLDSIAGNGSATTSTPKTRMFSTGSLSRTPLKHKMLASSSSSSAGANTTMPRLMSKSTSSASPGDFQLRNLRPPSKELSPLRIDEDDNSRYSSRKRGNLPPGIEELETLYAPMKNLNEPLPGSASTASSMPAPHPIWNYPNAASSAADAHHHRVGLVHPHPRGVDNDDAESEIGSVVAIPPALPPVQSHAVLESSLGHQLPRTPLRAQKFPDWAKSPPVPPRRTNSKLSLEQQQSQQQPRPKHLSLSSSPSTTTTSSSGGGAVYANAKSLLHRTSLMSTGSSENSSDSSSIPSYSGEIIPSGTKLPETPTGKSSSSAVEAGKDSSAFSWPAYANASTLGYPGQASNLESPSPSDHEHRSVSQIGEPPDSSALASDDGASSVGLNASGAASNGSGGVYVKMQNRPFPVDHHGSTSARGEGHYMNILYNAVQRQGGGGSVESAISPYIAMGGRTAPGRRSVNVRSLAEASVDDASAIYALPSTGGRKSSSSSSLNRSSAGSRTRSSSTSRLQEVTSRARKKLRSHGNNSNKARAEAQFKELLREVERKRHFRVGLNVFNSRPAAGLEYLAQRDFLEASPPAVARFLRNCDGLSRDKVGEFLGDLRDPFAMKVLACTMQEMDFSGLRIDKALRALLARVRVPGEAQKVERLMEVFGRRYSECNPGFAARLRSADSAVTLAFAVMLLNTDLHAPGVREGRRMSADDFVSNLRGVDGGADFDQKLLRAVYRSVKKREFEGGSDHVTQTRVIERSLQGEGRPALSAEHHRRLVCLCRLYEVTDVGAKRGTAGPDALDHPRDVFLFNDLLVVTKQATGGAKASPNCAKAGGGDGGGPFYSFRDAFPLSGVEVTLFHTPAFSHGVQIARKRDERVLLTLNARSEHDRYKFVMDLQESVFEVELMERAMAEMVQPPTPLPME